MGPTCEDEDFLATSRSLAPSPNRESCYVRRGLPTFLRIQMLVQLLGAYISRLTGRTVESGLTWRAEVRQRDHGRPDLEACTVDGKPVAKIEGKLGAALGEGQLTSYLDDLKERSGSGLLLVLVPRHRTEEMTTSVPSACRPFALNGNGPWQPVDASDLSVAVICWEEILEAMGTVCSEPFGGDLAQFQAMYRVLIGDDIEPITSDAEVLAWREKEGVYVNLVDGLPAASHERAKSFRWALKGLFQWTLNETATITSAAMSVCRLVTRSPASAWERVNHLRDTSRPSGCDSTMRRPSSQLSATALSRLNCRNDWLRAAGTFGYRSMSQSMLAARV